MIFEKVLDVTINVRNPINFCADKLRHTMIELQNNYVGKCFKGVHVEKIIKILNISACHIEATNVSGEGYVDVQFLAEVIIFSRGDILVGVEVVNHAQMIVGTYGSRAV